MKKFDKHRLDQNSFRSSRIPVTPRKIYIVYTICYIQYITIIFF